MPNPHRGEIEARLDGAPYRLCLTLGALAELEAAFGDTDMLALAERFQSGRLSAREALRIIGAGLRGAGHDISDEAVARMRAEGGAAGFVDIVARLLAATFGGTEGVRPSASDDTPAPPRSVTAPPTAAPAHAAGASARSASHIAPDSARASPEGRAAPAPFPGPT